MQKNKIAIGIIILIAAAISISLVTLVGLSNLGGFSRGTTEVDYRTTGDFEIRAYDSVATSLCGDLIELNITFGLFYFDNETQYATNQEAYESIEILERSYVVVESVLNGTHAYYPACQEARLLESSSSIKLWIPLVRRAITWNVSLRGDISECANISANTNLTLQLEFDIPDNDASRNHLLHLGYTRYYPLDVFAEGQTFSGRTQRGGAIFSGCQFLGLFLKFENATLNSQYSSNSRNFTVNSKMASFYHSDDNQIYVKLDDLFTGEAGFERYNFVSINVNFADVPDSILIWDGFIGDELGVYTHTIT